MGSHKNLRARMRVYIYAVFLNKKEMTVYINDDDRIKALARWPEERIPAMGLWGSHIKKKKKKMSSLI